MQTSIGWLPALALFLGLLIATINTIDATDIGSHIDTQDVASRDDLLLRVDAAGILPHGSTSDITSRDDAVPQSVARDAKTRANINDVAPRGVYAHAITDYATTRHEEAGLLDARGGNEATADSFKDALIKVSIADRKHEEPSDYQC